MAARLRSMPAIRIIDVTDDASFGLIPPCADPGFDHRSCDYWEDADRGSKAARSSWLEARLKPPPATIPSTGNPFLDDLAEPSFNPFASSGGDPIADNPFAPKGPARQGPSSDAPPKLSLLGRGLGVFGSYAKVLLVDEVAAAYAQFGPLSAYPRAQRLRDLYPQLPAAPLPAVITCIASTAEARHGGHARRLVGAVCDDLAGRGFAAVEAYPERGVRPDATSAATPEFWLTVGFEVAVDDEHFPVVRRELG
jgi:hypothetical protein